MKTNLLPPLLTANALMQRKPRIAIKIYNEEGDFWLLSHATPDLEPDQGPPVEVGVDQFVDLIATKIASQTVTPEKGFSTIGGMTMTLQDNDRSFTDKLRSIHLAGDSINNNKAELYIGFEGMTFSDYGILFTFQVDVISNNWVTYTIKLSDIQRVQRVTIFQTRETQLQAVIEGGNPVDLTTATVLDGSGIIELLDATVLSLVEHGADWDIDPSVTIGYFQLKGVDAAGNDTVETFSFTGFDGGNPNRVTGVTRSRFSTSAIAAKGASSGGNTAVNEYVYLDLPVPDMIYALLTGLPITDHLHIPSGIPDHWNAGVASADVDLPSFQNVDVTTNIGGTNNDLSELPFSFRGEQDENAKHFIANELLRANNLFLKINAFGQFSLTRFESVPQTAAPVAVFAESQIEKGSLNVVTRDATAIRNRFLINWEWRDDLNKFSRVNTFFDSISEDLNNVETDFLVLSFKGIRNRSRDILNNLENIAEGIRARYSNPAELISFRVPMAFGLQYEVGDIVGVDLQNFPDYANESTDADIKNLAKSVEIQSVEFDLETQMIAYQTYSTTGVPQPINFNESGSVTTVNHTGWKVLTVALDAAGITYTGNVGTAITITGSGTLVGGTTTAEANRYFHDFDITVNPGVVITTTLNFVLDAKVIQASGASFTSEGQGLASGVGTGTGISQIIITGVKPQNDAGLRGYFGGLDLADEASWLLNRGVGSERLKREPAQKSLVIPNKSQIESFNIRVDLNGNIVGLPQTLVGSSGSAGEPGVREDNGDPVLNYLASGSGGKSGGGMIFICDAFFTNGSTEMNTSGVNGTIGNFFPGSGNQRTYGGSGGGGYPGCLAILIKDRNAAIPLFVGSEYIANSGGITSEPTYVSRADVSGQYFDIPEGVASYGPYLDPGKAQNRSRNFAASTYLTKYISSDQVNVPSPGVDPTGPADLPTDITIQQQVDVPHTPLANIVTLQVNAVPPADTNYDYAYFEYRLLGDDQWVPINYGVSNTVVITPLTADGSTYEISVRSVNIYGELSTNRYTEEFTVAIVSKDPGEGNADPELPPISRLELVNRINNDSGWNQWKGPDAIFRWAKLSVTNGGNIITPTGVTDLYLQGYKVVVFRTDTGVILREETVEDSTYTYTLEKNRFDTDLSPVREIDFSVQALSRSGYVGEAKQFSYSNPQSAAVSGISTEVGTNSVVVRFTLPDDLDFVGTDFYIVQSDTADPFLETPVRIQGNEITVGSLVQGTDYRYGMTSVDQFGEGESTSIIAFTTTTIDAGDISGLGDWAVIDEATLAFITGGAIDDDAIPSAKIVEIVASKIITGTLQAGTSIQVGVGPDTGVLINGATGTLVSQNTGFQMVMGPVDPVSNPSANPLVLHAYDGATYPFWIDSTGAFKFGADSDNFVSFDGTNFVIETDNFSVDASGNASLTGTVNITSGSVDYSLVTGTKPPADADNTDAALTAGTTIGAGFLHLTGGTANIAIGETTFGEEGIQLQYNNGLPQMYIGDGTTEGGLTFTLDGFRIGDNVGLIGVDGYANLEEVFIHLRGHLLFGALGFESAPSLTGTISQSFGKTAILGQTNASQVNDYVCRMQLDDGGNDVAFSTDFGWKVVIDISDYLSLNSGSHIYIGASVGDLTTDTSFYFLIARKDGSEFNVQTFYNLGPGAPSGTATQAVTDGHRYLLEATYIGGLFTTTLTDLTVPAVYTFNDDDAIVFSADDMRNQVMIEITPSTTEDIRLSIYDYKIKGTRLP